MLDDRKLGGLGPEAGDQHLDGVRAVLGRVLLVARLAPQARRVVFVTGCGDDSAVRECSHCLRAGRSRE